MTEFECYNPTIDQGILREVEEVFSIRGLIILSIASMPPMFWIIALDDRGGTYLFKAPNLRIDTLTDPSLWSSSFWSIDHPIIIKNINYWYYERKLIYLNKDILKWN